MLARPLFRLHSLPIELPTEFLLIKMQVAIINPAFSFFARKVGGENEISPSPPPLPRTIYTTLRWSPCFPNVNNDIFQRFSRRIVLFQNIVLLPFFFYKQSIFWKIVEIFVSIWKYEILQWYIIIFGFKFKFGFG